MSVSPRARRKCDTAHSATSGQRNGDTKKISSADTWTIQNTAICTTFGSMKVLDLAERPGDR